MNNLVTNEEEPPNYAILYLEASQLPVIEELTDFMEMRQLDTLAELLEFPVSDLLKMDGFNYRCLKSLYGLLEDNHCTHLLKDE